MTRFCYFCKKEIVFLFWAQCMGSPFLHKRFQQFFLRTTGFQLKLLILLQYPKIFNWKLAKKIKVGMILGQNLHRIRPNVTKKVKKQALTIRFFYILHEEYLLKQKVVLVQTPQWKFKANIARNATFKVRLGPNFCPIWVIIILKFIII